MSRVYLNAFMNSIDELPAEIQRYITRIRELEIASNMELASLGITAKTLDTIKNSSLAAAKAQREAMIESEEENGNSDDEGIRKQEEVDKTEGSAMDVDTTGNDSSENDTKKSVALMLSPVEQSRAATIDAIMGVSEHSDGTCATKVESTPRDDQSVPPNQNAGHTDSGSPHPPDPKPVNLSASKRAKRLVELRDCFQRVAELENEKSKCIFKINDLVSDTQSCLDKFHRSYETGKYKDVEKEQRLQRE